MGPVQGPAALAGSIYTLTWLQWTEKHGPLLAGHRYTLGCSPHFHLVLRHRPSRRFRFPLTHSLHLIWELALQAKIKPPLPCEKRKRVNENAMLRASPPPQPMSIPPSNPQPPSPKTLGVRRRPGKTDLDGGAEDGQQDDGQPTDTQV